MTGTYPDVWQGLAQRILEAFSRCQLKSQYHDVIKWNYFMRYWSFVRGNHRSPVNSHHKGQWRGALMFSLICAWINAWVNNREAGDLIRHRAHYDVTVMNFQQPIVLKSYGIVSSLVLCCLSCVVSAGPFPHIQLTQLILQWRHDEGDRVSNDRRLNGLFNRLFGCRSKKISKLCVTGLCEGSSPVAGEFSQRASNAEHVYFWWCHHDF